MNIPDGYHPLDGSERRPSPTATKVGPADPNEMLTVSINLRRRPDGMPLPGYDELPRRPRLSEQEFIRRHGACAEDIDKVGAFAKAHGLTVAETHAARRIMRVTGTASQMQAAFAVELASYRHEIRLKRGGEPESETYRGRDGFIYIPDSLRSIVVGVFGLDNRRIVQANGPSDPNNNATPLSVPEVARLYNYPTNSASGQVIGILSFPIIGAYDPKDIAQYFANLGGNFTAPALNDVSVNGATNVGVPSGETTQDIEIAASFAPGAAINVYFTTHDQQGCLEALSRVAHPDPGDLPATVLSNSYVMAQADDPAGFALPIHASTAFINAMSAAFHDAAIQGVTVCVASGDEGSECGIKDGQVHVQYPGSDPWVLSVGGTTIDNVSGSSFDEYVWNVWSGDHQGATGGGVSASFPLPGWQADANVPASLSPSRTRGRGVPDVAGNANNASGYSGLICRGQPFVGEGTSASAPQWAGLIAVINAALCVNVGFVNPAIYALRGKGFRDIVPGGGPADNGHDGAPGYPAGPGWDACTGWGSPDGQALLEALRPIYYTLEVAQLVASIA
jgi:kumamolisin